MLERAFPYMEAAAIPGVAIPLLQDDCKDTAVDIDWVWNVVHLTSDDRTRRLDLDALRTEVETWFTPEALDAVLGPADGEADRVARAWLAAEGKRWRPFLTVCAYKALQDDPAQPLPGIAAEGRGRRRVLSQGLARSRRHRRRRRACATAATTLHAEHGVPVALNVGDLLRRRRLPAARRAAARRRTSARSSCGSPPPDIASSASARARSWRGCSSRRR